MAEEFTNEEFTNEEKHLIDVFKRTYSAVHIKNLGEEKIELIRNKSNPVLQNLIDNLEVEKNYNVDYVDGPSKLYVYKITNEKTIYLFGETHLKEFQCPQTADNLPFEDYIEMLSIQTPSFFDLYIETAIFNPDFSLITTAIQYKKLINLLIINKQILLEDAIYDVNRTREHFLGLQDLIVNSRTLEAIENKFMDCIDPKTRNQEKCQLMRLHYIDARSKTKPYIFIDNLNYIHLLEFVFNNDIDTILYLIEKVNAIQFLQNTFLSDENPTDKIFNYIVESDKSIREQVKQTYYKEEITEFIKNKISELINSDRLSYINDIVHRNYSDNKKINQLYIMFSDISVFIMDIYCLCRIFKNYKLKPGTLQPAQSYNIIVYTGSYHTKLYREFLNYIQAELKYKYSSYTNLWEKVGCTKMMSCKDLIPIWLHDSLYYNQNDPNNIKSDILQNVIPIRNSNKIKNIQDFKDVLNIMKFWGVYDIPDTMFDFVFNRNITEEEYLEIKRYQENIENDSNIFQLIEALDIIYYRNDDNNIETENKLFELKYKPYKNIDMDRIIHMFMKKTRDDIEEEEDFEKYF